MESDTVYFKDKEMLDRAEHSSDFLVQDIQALCSAKNPYISEFALTLISKVVELRVMIQRINLITKEE